MIATDRFVFLHLHKSGGTFVNECLLRCLPGARQLGYHLPRSMIPAPLAALPVLGLVRNPWSYYVSWYAFQSQLPRGNALFQVLSEEGTLGFKDTVRHMLELGAGGGKLDALVHALPPDYTGRGLNLPGHVAQRIGGSGLGFYGFLYHYMYEGQGALHIGRIENLAADLERMLEAVGQPPPAEMRAFIRTERARNASSHGDYASYYDDELRALVAQRDAPIVERHGYAFGA
jgi:hypothetical protein